MNTTTTINGGAIHDAIDACEVLLKDCSRRLRQCTSATGALSLLSTTLLGLSHSLYDQLDVPFDILGALDDLGLVVIEAEYRFAETGIDYEDLSRAELRRLER